MGSALVVSGGGDKGAFAVGAIEMLRHQGITFDLIAGTSTGSLIAPLVAIDDIDELVRQYTNVEKSDVFKLNWHKLFWKGVYHTKPIEKLIRSVMLGPKSSRYAMLMAKEAPPVLLCTVALQTQQVVYFSQSDLRIPEATPWPDPEGFVAAVLGSLSQPVIMTVPEYKGRQYVDGGVREIAPIGIAARAGIDRVFVIINMPERTEPEDKTYGNLAEIGLRTLSVMTEEILLNDVRVASVYNDALKLIDNPPKGSRFHGKRPLDIVVIRPDEPLPSDGMTFGPKLMQRMRGMGHLAAERALASGSV